MTKAIEEPRFLHLKGKAKLINITTPVEGQNDGDAGIGVSLRMETVTTMAMANLMLASTNTSEHMLRTLWDVDQEMLRVNAMDEIKLKREFHGSYLTIFNMKKVEASMKNIQMAPQSIPGNWWVKFSVYVSKPSKDFLMAAAKHQKTQVDYDFEQRSLTDDYLGDAPDGQQSLA